MRPLRSLFLVALLSSVAATASVAAPDSVEERLRRLEATVQTLQDENADLRRQLGAPAAGAPSAVGPVPGGHETRLVIGGFLQAQAEFGDVGDGRFAGAFDRIYFRRARMYLAGAFAEHFDFKIEGEFAGNSITPATGIRASANEVFVGWNRFPAAYVRVGQLKPAFGGEQLLAETKSATVERYLGSDRLTDPRQLGVGLSGDFLNKRVSYLVVVGDGNGPNLSANDNSKFMHTARVSAVPMESRDFGRLAIGLNGMYSDDGNVSRPGFGFRSTGGAVDNIFVGRRTGWGADAGWHYGLLDLSAELLRVEFEPRNRLPVSKFSGQAWELAAAYFLVPQTLQGVLRRESFDPNTSAAGDQTNNWVVGLNYLIRGEELRLMVDYMFGHVAEAPNQHGRLLTRFQIIF